MLRLNLYPRVNTHWTFLDRLVHRTLAFPALYSTKGWTFKEVVRKSIQELQVRAYNDDRGDGKRKEV